MKTRKIVLLSACAFLFCVCVVQLIMGAKNPVKTLSLSQNPDKIIIAQGNNEIVFTQTEKDWTIGNDGFFANQADIDNIIKTIKEIKVLDTVGKISNNLIEERYELHNEKAIIVTAQKAGKEIITVRVGKTSATGSQSYITLNNKNDVYLVSGNFPSAFSKSEKDMTSKSVYSISGNDITSVDLQTSVKTWGVAKDANGTTWSLTGNAPRIIIDSDYTDAWVQSLAFLTADSWLEDDAQLPKTKEISVTINTPKESITVDIYSSAEGTETKYICTSNKTSHKFTISKLAAEKYIKAADELVASNN